MAGPTAVRWTDDYGAGPTDTEVGAAADLYSEWLREVIPDEPPYPAAELAAELRERPADDEVRLAVAERDGAIVGVAMLHLDRSSPANRHLAWLEDLVVARDHRRSGVGRELLAAVAQAAAADGRRIALTAAPVDAGSTTAFAERAGATRGLVERQNRLATADLDRSMLERWVDRSADRAAGYSLVAFDGLCPDDLLEEYARLVVVMDTAPHSDVWEASVVTPAMVREQQEASLRRGRTGWTICARHDATGQLVGYTALDTNPFRPWLAEQGDTGVEPTHRDRGLGRWLKATNALRLLDELPEVTTVETWNAAVNQPMLSINDAMGFRPVAEWQEWEIPVSP